LIVPFLISGEKTQERARISRMSVAFLSIDFLSRLRLPPFGRSGGSDADNTIAADRLFRKGKTADQASPQTGTQSYL
jgi:hypothetical protein